MNRLCISSEIGKLKRVIVHQPGNEIQQMIPDTAKDYLFNDILDNTLAKKHHSEMTEILKQFAQVYEVTTLLEDTLRSEKQKETLLKSLFKVINIPEKYFEKVIHLSSEKLAKLLIEGLESEYETLTNFLSNHKYLLPPIPNILFTRDAIAVINHHVLNCNMAYKVRTVEQIIMRHIFEHHQELGHPDFYFPSATSLPINATIEGGDLLVLREDVLAIGISERTTPQAVDHLIIELKKIGLVKHIFCVVLPKHVDMIHLDMVFTMVDHNYACIYEPAILGNMHIETIHINISENTNRIQPVKNILQGLQSVKIDLEPVFCGGDERTFKDRELRMCGSNLFAMGPGQIIGYKRNIKTFEQLEKVAKMPTILVNDILNGTVKLSNYSRFAICFNGSELSRGGGGTRCMTLPIERDDL